MKLIYFFAIAGAILAGEAFAKIKDDSCTINVLQFYDRVYDQDKSYIDESVKSLFEDPKLGNYSQAKIVEIDRDDFNDDMRGSYTEAIHDNVNDGELYATFYPSCDKFLDKDNFSGKNEKYKWKYHCHLKMEIGRYTEDEDGDGYSRKLVESRERVVKGKIKGEFSMEQQSEVDQIREKYRHFPRLKISKLSEEVFNPIRRESFPEMRDLYLEAIEKILRHNKFDCKENK